MCGVRADSVERHGGSRLSACRQSWRLLGEGPGDVQGRVVPLFDELRRALAELVGDARGEHALRDWADRAALLWAVALSASRRYGMETVRRAARRALSRNVPVGLLLGDRARVEELRAVAGKE